MYDYIIVGAGSAGCVLAARLSEDASVLLLEAGPTDDAPEIAMPAATPSLWRGTYAWDDVTTPQPEAGGRRMVWPHGRTLGGSSSINGMVYIRGNRLDYDTWRDAYGCTGWGFADLLPYFRRAEDQQRGESFYHGVGGPLRVEDLHDRHPLPQAWVQAAVAHGLRANDDFNGAEQEGVGFYQSTQRHGRRWSTASAYLRPAVERNNLVVETGAMATKVVIERGRAVGVRYVRHGVEREARATREIVLSGGAINSPHLLMLSGIGPAEHLRQHGIDVIADVPQVGAGLQDHLACAAIWRTPNTRNTWEDGTPEHMARWQRDGRGPMASHGVEAGGFARSRDDLPAPDLQFGVVGAPGGPDDLEETPTWRGVTILVGAVDINSRGRVALRSADPATRPAIDPGYLTDESDLEALVAGVRRARQMAACDPLAGHIAGEHMPGDHVRDDELRSWVRNHATTIFHPTSTCAMGGSHDSVCDPALQVRGVDGLRVVDASVMPAVIRGNTNAPTIAIAERASDLILGNTPLAPAEPQDHVAVAGSAG